MSNKIFTMIGSAFGKMGTKMKKHSPEILVVSGVVGIVGSAILACRATLKVNDILSEAKGNIENIHKCSEDESMTELYSDEDRKKDLTIVYFQTGIKFVKLYAPAIILGALSISGMIASNHILRKRSFALAAAYSAVDKGFKEYRSRVVEKFGTEVDKELRHNLKAVTLKETMIDENGVEVETEKTVKVPDQDSVSDYARFFDEACSGWEKDSEYNLYFLRLQQQIANDRLIATGHLFLNEVYDMLGIPRTKAGQVVGWVYDKNSSVGDNYVDFGIYDIHREKSRDFVNGYERSILLDFNVDGYILDKI